MKAEVVESIRGNLLLSQLAVHERNAVHRAAEAVVVKAGESLLRARTQSAYVFFPTTCVVSLLRTMRDGNCMDIALIGSEGIIGLDVFMGSRVQIDDAVVHRSGCAYRIPAEELRRQLQNGGGLQKGLLRFAYALFSQVAQNAVCVRFHPPEARLSRWLMMVNDRTSSIEVGVDLRAAAAMLADSPVVVKRAIDQLQGRGAITLTADAITITDRDALEVAACECYETVREEYDRTLAS